MWIVVGSRFALILRCFCFVVAFSLLNWCVEFVHMHMCICDFFSVPVLVCWLPFLHFPSFAFF